MRMLGPVLFALLFAPSVASASSVAEQCEVADAKYLSDLQSALSRRAVEAVNLSAAAQSEDNPLLMRLISPAATFSLGAGDVGRPLGTGLAGARVLAETMKADRFRFLGWDYIPTPVANPCAIHKVEVEFVDTLGQNVFPVTFTFEAGRIVAAAGWSRSYQSGPVTAVQS